MRVLCFARYNQVKSEITLKSYKLDAEDAYGTRPKDTFSRRIIIRICLIVYHNELSKCFNRYVFVLWSIKGMCGVSLLER